MKYTETVYTFACDDCGRIAGQSTNENEALQTARDYVRKHGWQWNHPHWGLRCTSCLKSLGKIGEEYDQGIH